MKFKCLALLFLITTSVHAQQIDRAKDLLKANKLMEAKAMADEMAKDVTLIRNGDTWYTITKIYGAIAKDPVLSKQVPNAWEQSFTALKNYTEMDDKMLISLQIDGYKPINEIYTGYYQAAANSFNAKEYPKALEGFKNAIEVSTFMTNKGWINLKLDTNSVLYAGVAAEKISRFDEAAKYYGQLAEAKVKGESFVEIYKWVANYYYEQKNTAMAEKYIAIGRDVYPGDAFWDSIELDMVREKGDKQALFALYEKVIAANPTNHLYHYNYAVELYQYSYNTDASKRPANSETLIEKVAGLTAKLTSLKPEYSRGQLFGGQVRYNNGVDLLNRSKAITSTTPGDVKIRADLKAAALTKFDMAIPYLTEVARLLEQKTKLTMEEKSDLKEAYDLLITIYEQKGSSEKVKEYETKFNEVDKNH